MSTLRPRGGGDDPELGAAPAPDPSTGKPAPFDSGSGLGGSGSGGSGLSGSGPGGSGPGGSGGGGGDGLGALLRRPAFVLVCLLSVLTRFVHLGHPPSVVFDEVHFGKFTNHYLTGHYYFDIHPPLGKITLWIWGSLINYSAHYTFRNIGDEYAGPDYAYLRMCPAFFSALVPPMAYLALSEGGLSAAGALAGASFVLWDNCIVGEGKFILVDSQLFFWSTAAVYCYLRAKFRTRLVFRADGTLSLAANAEFVKWHLAAGVTMFLALSIKWTALGLVGVVGIDVAVRLLIDLRDGARLELWIKEFLLKLVLLLVIPLGVYFLMFAIHFWLLPLSGDGDVFMTREFKARLVGAKGVPAGTVPKGLLASIFELQRTMFVSNEGLAATHTWGSTWDQWPFMAGKGVLYWTHPNTMIYLLGNPLVWWGSTVAVFAFITMMLWPAVEAFTGGRGAAAAGGYAALPSSVHDDSSDAGAKGSGGAPRLRLVERVRRARIRSLGVFFLSGYMANLLPYMLIRRVCFVYHYIPALIQGSLLAAVVLEICTFDKPRVRMGIAMGIFALQGLVFYKFSPWTYGFHTNNEALRWRSTWT